MTSHDCVGKLRRLLQMKRIGHGGTLDPAATGVLPMALGSATRLLQFLPGAKAYRGTIRFGVTTTTDDLEGEPITQEPAPQLTLEAVKEALAPFLGAIEQVPPNYSAIQVQGQRLYDLARAGKPIAAKPRSVEIDCLEVLDWRPGEYPEVDLAIACGPGTYIRAIARDLGQVLGVGGTLAALTRTMSSGLPLETSVTFAALDTQLQAQQFFPIAPATVLQHLPEVQLAETMAQRWIWGQKLPWPEADPGAEWVRVHREGGEFLGVGQRVEAVLAPRVVFSQSRAEGNPA
jgi:tRNA pseudouridine55 synthase